jgi:hypothetical protein
VVSDSGVARGDADASARSILDARRNGRVSIAIADALCRGGAERSEAAGPVDPPNPRSRSRRDELLGGDATPTHAGRFPSPRALTPSARRPRRVVSGTSSSSSPGDHERLDEESREKEKDASPRKDDAFSTRAFGEARDSEKRPNSAYGVRGVRGVCA